MFSRVRDQWAAILICVAAVLTAYLGLQARQKAILRVLEQTEVSEVLYYLFHDSSHGFAILRQDGRMISWNQRMLDLTGYTKLEMNEFGLKILLNEKDKSLFNKTIASLSDVENIENVIVHDTEVRSKNGAWIPVHVSIRLAEAGSGKLYAVGIVDKAANVKELQPSPLLGASK